MLPVCQPNASVVWRESLSAQRRPTFSLGHSPSPHSQTLTYSHTALACRFNALRPCNLCIHGLLLNFQPQMDGRLSWLTHSRQFAHKLASRQP